MSVKADMYPALLQSHGGSNEAPPPQYTNVMQSQNTPTNTSVVAPISVPPPVYESEDTTTALGGYPPATIQPGKVLFTIPSVTEKADPNGSHYVAFNVYVNNSFHSSIRYSKFLALHKSLARTFGRKNLAEFPCKCCLSLTAAEVNGRRDELECYLQHISANSDILNCHMMQSFLDGNRIATQKALASVNVASAINGVFPAPTVTVVQKNGESKAVPIGAYNGPVYDAAAGRVLDEGGVIPGYELPSTVNEGGILFLKSPRKFSPRATIPRHINCGNIISSSEFDFRTARFVYPVTTLRATQVLGKCIILVPPGVKVVAKGISLLGSHGKGAQRTGFGGSGSGPTIKLVGGSLLASCKVFVDSRAPPVTVLSTQ